MKVGDSLRAFARHVCTAETRDRVIDPLIADLQFEHDKALGAGRAWHARNIRVQAYLAFWTTFVMCGGRLVRRWAAADDHAIGRTLGFLLAANLAITAGLVLIPFSHMSVPPGTSITALVGNVVLQALSVSLPFGLPLALAIALRGSVVNRRLFRSILVIALTCMVVDLALCGWILPASNQAFRVMVSGRPEVAKGANELTFGELVSRLNNGAAWPAPHELLLSLHGRLVICVAPVILAWFALTVPRLVRRNSLARLVIGIAALTYLVILIAMRPTAYADSWPPMWAAIWFPNILFVGLSTLFVVSARRRSAEASRSTR